MCANRKLKPKTVGLSLYLCWQQVEVSFSAGTERTGGILRLKQLFKFKAEPLLSWASFLQSFDNSRISLDGRICRPDCVWRFIWLQTAQGQLGDLISPRCEWTSAVPADTGAVMDTAGAEAVKRPDHVSASCAGPLCCSPPLHVHPDSQRSSAVPPVSRSGLGLWGLQSTPGDTQEEEES